MIRIDHLTKRFGDFTAVDDVSLEIRPGEVFAFLGPNGSGKTTTMKSMVGLVLPSAGRISVGGIDIAEDPQRARSLVSYLPQRVVFPENMTSRETIRFFAGLRNLSRSFADEALRNARFNGASDKLVSELSGGMVQRLALTIVSMPDVPVLILDEPTASLDPLGVKRFREFVLEQKARGRTIIFSTHLLPEAEQLADRVGIFVSGRLVGVQTIQQVRDSFRENGTIEDMYLQYVQQQGQGHEE